MPCQSAEDVVCCAGGLTGDEPHNIATHEGNDLVRPGSGFKHHKHAHNTKYNNNNNNNNNLDPTAERRRHTDRPCSCWRSHTRLTTSQIYSRGQGSGVRPSGPSGRQGPQHQHRILRGAKGGVRSSGKGHQGHPSHTHACQKLWGTKGYA